MTRISHHTSQSLRLSLVGEFNVPCSFPSAPLPHKSQVRNPGWGDGYCCQFCIDVEVSDIQPLTGNEIGLDVGIESFYTDSNGYQEANPKFLRKAEKAIKHSQRRIYKTIRFS